MRSLAYAYSLKFAACREPAHNRQAMTGCQGTNTAYVLCFFAVATQSCCSLCVADQTGLCCCGDGSRPR
jgi:hypothetical protein